MTNTPKTGADTGLPEIPKPLAAPKPLSAMLPHDRLMVAISILQSDFLARDSNLSADETFGIYHMPDRAAEHAITILIDLLECFDGIGEVKA